MSVWIGDIIAVDIDNVTCVGRVIKMRVRTLSNIRYYDVLECKFKSLDIELGALRHATKEEKDKLVFYSGAYNKDVGKCRSDNASIRPEKRIRSMTF